MQRIRGLGVTVLNATVDLTRAKPIEATLAAAPAREGREGTRSAAKDAKDELPARAADLRAKDSAAEGRNA